MKQSSCRCAVAVDMGGTNIKCSVVTDSLELSAAESFPANSSAGRELLLDGISQIIKCKKDEIEAVGNEFCGVAISTPGPFDYAAGKSGMRGKYDSIFGIDLRKEIRERSGLQKDIPILFMQDAAAFLIGEHITGNAVGERNCSCVTLGTGVGYACISDGKVLLNDKGGPYYVFAFQNHGGELIEDLISGRAIKKRFGTDGKALSKRAAAGDPYAISAFYDIGKTLGEGLCAIPETGSTDKLIIGGQVAYSFPFLENGIRDGLGSIATGIKTVRAKFPANAALIGSTYRLFRDIIKK